MHYDPRLGMQGNIKLLFKERNSTGNLIYNEVNDRQTADAENREAVEQTMTDLYLDGIEAQQDITEIQLQLLEG